MVRYIVQRRRFSGVTVTLFSTGGTDWRGQTVMDVRFSKGRKQWHTGGFAGSPMHADDNVVTACAAVTWSLSQDDVPAWLAAHREAMECEAMDREERARR